MTQDLRIALTTSLNDKLVGPLRRALGEVENNFKQIEKELQRTDAASTRVNNTMANMRGPQLATKQAAELARETQRAISLADRLRSAWSATGNIIKGVAAGVAAVQAAKMVLSGPMATARGYDLQLAHMSNVAYSELTPVARAARTAVLDSTIRGAVMKGGGSRDDALAAYNTMLASGVMTDEQTRHLLPLIQKYSTAGNVESTTMSDIAVKMLQSGFTEQDIPEMFDEALMAGQLGGFELKDMAKWLPKLIPAAKKSGLGGRAGFRRVLAAAQMSVNTAGSPDEAGNNLVDTLLQMTSQATQMHAMRLTKHGGTENIDVAKSLAAAREKGTDTLTAFVNLVERVGKSYPAYVDLQKRIAAMPGDQVINGKRVMSEEKKQALDDQASVLMGAGIGSLVHNRQELMPLLAILNGRDRDLDIQKQLTTAKGQNGQSNFDRISMTDAFKVQQSENAQLFAQTDALKGANAAMGDLAKGTTDLYQKYPKLAEAIEGGRLALWSLAAAAGVASGALLLLGGKGAKDMLGRGAAAAGAPAATGAASAAANARKAASVSSFMYGPEAATAATGLARVGMLARAGLSAANPLMLIEALTGPSDEDIAKLREMDRAKSGYRGKGFNDPRLLGIGEGVSALQSEAGAKRSEELAQVIAKLDQTMNEVKALSTRPVLVQLDGREIASSSNQHNAFEARRN